MLTVGGRKVTLVDYSLVPDMAIVDPRLTLSMPPALTADTGVDALTHALEACVSIFASPYTDAFCLQALNLILDALPRAVRGRRRPRGAHRHGQRRHDRRAGVLQRVRRRQPRARPRGRRPLRHRPRPRQRRSSCRTCCATTPRCRRKFMPAPGLLAPTSRPRSTPRSAWVLGLGGHGEEERARAAVRARRRAARGGRDAPHGRRPRHRRRRSTAAAIRRAGARAFRDPSLRTNPRMPLLDRARATCWHARPGAHERPALTDVAIAPLPIERFRSVLDDDGYREPAGPARRARRSCCAGGRCGASTRPPAAAAWPRCCARCSPTRAAPASTRAGW